MGRPARVAAAALAALVLAGAWAGLAFRRALRASLPQADGQRVLAGLVHPVTIGRDARGVPTIRGEGRNDVARGLGFVHAQERFFQMDLQRRLAAGELAELLGPPVLKYDREYRVHRFRDVARRVLEQAEPEQRAALEAYAAGVNAGLGALGARPFEYLVLARAPEPWRAEDSVLCLLAMFIQLQDDPAFQASRLGFMRERMPPALFAFLNPSGTEWDAPLEGGPSAQPPVPGPEVVDLRRQGAGGAPASAGPIASAAVGSNNWAVAGSRTADGRAILANDMHLAISVPNTWYRVSMVWGAGGEEHRVTGVTLPGTCTVAVGSNGSVAWGFTNSYSDCRDLVVLEQPPGDPDRYLTPEGPRRLEHRSETIRVRWGRDQTLDVLESVWGPVVDTDARGRRRALRWVAHDPEAVNFRAMGLETARTLEEAQAVANRSGIPAQNFLAADAQGHIGWTIMGVLPRRAGLDRTPASWADGRRGWHGWLDPKQYPRIIDPPGGQLWTANARVADGPDLEALGDGGYFLGARARQIRDDLRALEHPREQDMLTVQLDDRALFLARWRDLLLGTLTPEALARDPRRAELRRLALDWGGRAAVDSAGYRIVRGFRLIVHELVEAPFAAAFKAGTGDEKRFRTGLLGQAEGPVWALVTRRPAHLLDPKFKDWDALLLQAADTTRERLSRGGTLAGHTWGRLNSPRVRHPLARILPFLGWWLDMPTLPIPGDAHMPRVQDREFGASERMAVSPGHEADGYFMMPCGQSGHPLSPNYGDGHRDWVAGKPGPFLPGPAVHVLTLVPA